MRYNLTDLAWQQFEVLSFKCLTEAVSPDIQFIDGGSDKGREIIFTGQSKTFRTTLKGKWIFQCKHKSSSVNVGRNQLKADLKKELKKVFITNNLRYDNYILVTNLTITGDLLDELNAIFQRFVSVNPDRCKNFDIFSYKNFEEVISATSRIVWQFPNILSHPDFELLFANPFKRISDVRTKGWLQGVANRRLAFIVTNQYDVALKSLDATHMIILTGPPKSGKTFHAEMIALNLLGSSEYEAVKVDDPDDIERFFSSDRKQVFVCDDAFGSHVLSYTDADDWNRKLESIFALADADHKFLFSSRENIYTAFKNYAKDFDDSFLNQTVIKNENLSESEREAILERYTQLSALGEADKFEILSELESFVVHPNFSPESIRAFFSNFSSFDAGLPIRDLLFQHLQTPDVYLKNVFYNLGESSKAAVLAVLCAIEDDEGSVQKKFAEIRDDLQIKKLESAITTLEELDGAIIKIARADMLGQIDFYHPSMQEFLIREAGKDAHGALRKIILCNINTILLEQFVLKVPHRKISSKEFKAIEIDSEDFELVKSGVRRILQNDRMRLYHLMPIMKWLTAPETTASKVFARGLFGSLKEFVNFVYANVFSTQTFGKFPLESCDRWMNFLLMLKTLELVTGAKRPDSVANVLTILINDKRGDPKFWRVGLAANGFLEEGKFETLIGPVWLDNFKAELNNEIDRLGQEVYGSFWPDVEEYKKQLRVSDSKEEKLDTGRTWYPRFLTCRTKINLLKQNKGRVYNKSTLDGLTTRWDLLMKISDRAKNRHRFIVSKGWWPGGN
jgi:hypothetical protein